VTDQPDKWAGAITVDRIEVWHAKDGYRWRVVSPNGKVTAESGEAYTRMRDCLRAAEDVKAGMGTAVIVYDSDPAGAAGPEGHLLEEIEGEPV
jgi:uncharacterized protein YegP (UPF0339 family)